MVQAIGLSQSTVARIWRAHGLRVRRRLGGGPVIDVTGKAIEETAADILRIKKDRDTRKLEQREPTQPVKTP